MLTTTRLWTPRSGMPAANFGAPAMNAGYSLAGRALFELISRDSLKFSSLKKLLNPADPKILVVDGCGGGSYDRMQDVLRRFKIVHAHLADPSKISDALREIPNVGAMLINCAPEFPPSVLRTVSSFVRAGNLLMTTDWGIKTVIERGFPGTIERNGKVTMNEFVEVDYLGSDPMIEQISRAAKFQPRWWLEDKSLPFCDCRRPDWASNVIIHSSHLGERYGTSSAMVRFRWGAGVVVHMISHALLQQKGEVVSEIADMNTISEFSLGLGMSKDLSSIYEDTIEQISGFDLNAAASTMLSAAIFLEPLLKYVH